MIKATVLAALFAGLAMGANTASEASPRLAPLERDTRIIVEVDRSLSSLTREGVLNTQNAVINSIRSYVTRNFEVTDHFKNLNNAFAISVNNSYVEQIKALPGVKSVTVDKLHIFTQSVPTEPDYAPGSVNRDPTPTVDENVSATTMQKSNDTNDGEGTVIAILDNEFYFRTAHDGEQTWLHETFSPLPTGTKVRFTTRPDLSETYAKTNSRVGAKINNNLGTEGSCYLNNKVPFYFDYGGEQRPDNSKFFEDFDVSSDVSFHGSHVASIASGNADTYKGIAPKAQLVCMKVFTNLKASEVEEKLGLGSSTGAYDLPILRALEDCMELHVDGINMSLGSDLNDFDLDSITLKTLQELSASGILTAISAGNAGKTSYSFAGAYGNWTTDMAETGILGGYANNHNTMSVASAHGLKSYFKTGFKFGSRIIPYEDQIVTDGFYAGSYVKEYLLEDLLEGRTEVNYTYLKGFGVASDYKESVEGKVVIVNRGQTSFADKLDQATAHNAIGLVIINNDPTSTDFNFHISLGSVTDPGMPIALCLFKDKDYFNTNPKGTFNFLGDDHVQDEDRAKTLSTFSSDGPTFDLDLKPEITAPGSSIRGACPPQTKDDKLNHPYDSYTYIDGTSMSSPNYAGSQALVLSKVATSLSRDSAEYKAFRDSVDMRLMSTAVPMNDYESNPEILHNYALSLMKEDPNLTYENAYEMAKNTASANVKEISSPRIQGAGMVNLDGAYHTNVYLEGMDSATGKTTGKSKINLRNNEEINVGNVELSFIAHNTDSVAHKYRVSYSIMRPAVKWSNDFISTEYNKESLVEVASKEEFTGFSYWKRDTVTDESEQGYHYEYVLYTVEGNVSDKDVVKVTKDFEYYASEEDCRNDVLTTWKAGNYYYDARSNDIQKWKLIPVYPYQSTQDTLIENVSCGEIEVPANTDKKIDLPSHQLSSDALRFIDQYFEYGCYLEGYVTLEEVTDGVEKKIDLSIPYLGYYAGAGKDFNSAPVVEPFDFEKEAGKVYPSDLVSDITKSLMGKGNADFHSTMVSTYLEDGKEFNFDPYFQNDKGLKEDCKDNDNLNLMGQYKENVVDEQGHVTEVTKYDGEHLFAGNPKASNTIVLTQFVLRSVNDNYFTLTNNKTGEVVVHSALLDTVYDRYYGSASDMMRYPLFKSHVDQSYMGGGVMCHRAYAIIPLYNTVTGASFASGDYTLTFNYQLVGTMNWVSKDYTIHIDSESPVFDNAQVSGDNVRLNFKDANLTYLAMNGRKYDFVKENDTNSYVEFSKDDLRDMMNDRFNEELESGRLFIKLEDIAAGTNNAILRFDTAKDASGNVIYGEDDYPEYNFSKYAAVQHRDLEITDDFEDLGNSVLLVKVDELGNLTPFTIDDYVKVTRSGQSDYTVITTGGGCGGNVATTSVILSTVSFAFVSLILVAYIKNKKKKTGGQE